MPLFLCDRCKVVENTGLGAYWMREPGDKLCSECATGSWHGHFPRTFGDEGVTRIGREQFCYGVVDEKGEAKE